MEKLLTIEEFTREWNSLDLFNKEILVDRQLQLCQSVSDIRNISFALQACNQPPKKPRHIAHCYSLLCNCRQNKEEIENEEQWRIYRAFWLKVIHRIEKLGLYGAYSVWTPIPLSFQGDTPLSREIAEANRKKASYTHEQEKEPEWEPSRAPLTEREITRVENFINNYFESKKDDFEREGEFSEEAKYLIPRLRDLIDNVDYLFLGNESSKEKSHQEVLGSYKKLLKSEIKSLSIDELTELYHTTGYKTLSSKVVLARYDEVLKKQIVKLSTEQIQVLKTNVLNESKTKKLLATM